MRAGRDMSAFEHSWRMTGNPGVIRSPVGLVPRNALVVIDELFADYRRARKTEQLDIIWPTTGTPNSTDAPGRPLFSNDWQSVYLAGTNQPSFTSRRHRTPEAHQ